MRFLNNTKLIIVTSFIFVVLDFLPVLPPLVAHTDNSSTISVYSSPSEVVAGAAHLPTRRHLPHLRYTNVTLTGPVGS